MNLQCYVVPHLQAHESIKVQHSLRLCRIVNAMFLRPYYLIKSGFQSDIILFVGLD